MGRLLHLMAACLVLAFPCVPFLVSLFSLFSYDGQAAGTSFMDANGMQALGDMLLKTLLEGVLVVFLAFPPSSSGESLTTRRMPTSKSH